MNKRTWSIIGLVALGVLLFWGGAVYGQTQPSSWMMGRVYGNQANWTMMENYPGMSMAPNMMMGNGGMMGGMGMMGNVLGTPAAEPLSVAAAETAVQAYVDRLNDTRLIVGEIMIFDNHAYAQVMDTTTGQGAFELLVDPATGNVFPEPGPNMMWNTEYGMMGGTGAMPMMGGMMGGFVSTPDGATPLSAAEAVASANRYLTQSGSDATADTAAVAFPGYYTLHTQRDGEVTGMLSVNAYSGQVFIHQWHGRFIEMAGDDHD